MGMFSHDEEDDAPPAECTYVCKCGNCPKESEYSAEKQPRSPISSPISYPSFTSELGRRKNLHHAACVRLEMIKQSKANILEQERKATIEFNETRLAYEELRRSSFDAVRSMKRTGLPDLHDVGKMVQVFGYTFKVKDQIRALGGKWDPISKTWSVPKAKEEEAKRLIASSSSTYRSGSGGYIFREDDTVDVDMLDHYRALYGDAAADGWGSD